MVGSPPIIASSRGRRATERATAARSGSGKSPCARISGWSAARSLNSEDPADWAPVGFVDVVGPAQKSSNPDVRVSQAIHQCDHARCFGTCLGTGRNELADCCGLIEYADNKRNGAVGGELTSDLEHAVLIGDRSNWDA